MGRGDGVRSEEWGVERGRERGGSVGGSVVEKHLFRFLPSGGVELHVVNLARVGIKPTARHTLDEDTIRYVEQDRLRGN